MNDIISKLKSPKECANYEKNVLERGRPDLAVAARKRALELRAAAHGATTQAERECLEARYAYERVLSQRSGKNTRASRTWQMIDRHGIIGAVDAFEAVILRHPGVFSTKAVEHSRMRLSELSDT